MIVLDEHLAGLGVETAIRQWYRGRVCGITELRPGSVIKDEAIPHLREISPCLRRLLRLPEFKTCAERMGRVARISGERAAFYQVGSDQTYLLPLS